MNIISDYFRDWSWKERAWLAFVLLFQTGAWFVQDETTFMLIMTLTSSLNLVLGAKGKIEGLYFAIINSAMYAWQCYGIPLYGEVMYHVLYSMPISAAAIYLWRHHLASTGEVEFRKMSLKEMLITTIATIAGIFIYAEILKYMGGSFAFMDSLTTVVAVIASYLYMKRYAEQWFMWIVVNVLEVAMWIMVYFSGDEPSGLIILMHFINLLNCIYGFWNWRQISTRLAVQN
ncbi:nicotinamide riboside transporter PnuC [Bisgaard Taxon 45]